MRRETMRRENKMCKDSFPSHHNTEFIYKQGIRPTHVSTNSQNKTLRTKPVAGPSNEKKDSRNGWGISDEPR